VRVRWAEYVEYMESMRNIHKILVGKPEGKRPLGRPGHRRENNNNMEVKEMGWKSVDWIHLAQDGDQLIALVNMIIYL
jgi:hypothetical protein